MRPRSSFSVALAAVAGLSAISFAASPARADVSSWLAVGGGGFTELDHVASQRTQGGSITYSVGAGSSPLAPFVLGVLFRGQTFFGLGTDVGAAVRATTGGFARGEWGLALDAGVAWRLWGSGHFGDWPIQGVLTLGAPWGFQLALGTELWSVSGGTPAQGFTAALEIDLLRLTVMRQGPTERWWPNPSPAGGHQTASLASW